MTRRLADAVVRTTGFAYQNSAADWQRIHPIWDKRHRVRIAALAIAAVLLTDVLVR